MSAQSELPSIANLSISSPTSITNGLTYSSHSSPPSEPIQISIPLPNTHIPTRIHIHLTINPTSLLLFITTRFGSAPQAEQPHTSALADTTELAAAEADVASGDAPPLLVDPFAAREQERPTTAGGVEMGSFVVAIPNLRNPTAQPHSTPLYIRESTLETTTRIARILAAKTQRPCYVGNSMDFGSAGLGGSVEEVMEGIREVIRVVRAEVDNFPAATVAERL